MFGLLIIFGIICYNNIKISTCSQYIKFIYSFLVSYTQSDDG